MGNRHFGELLTKGILAIKSEERKNISLIQEELEYAIGREVVGSSIAYWRKGNVPTKKDEFDVLIHEIERRGKMSEEWVVEIYAQTPFEAHVRDEGREERPFSPKGGRQKIIGRSNLIQQIMNSLTTRDGQLLVGLAGQGGIGKTKLAEEIAYQCIESQQFKAVVWLTADGKSFNNLHQDAFTFETVLNHLGEFKEDPQFLSYSYEEKIYAIQAFLQHTPLLIVLDNMETAVTHQEEIIDKLLPILGQSRALLTSRIRFQSHVLKNRLLAINLQGLSLSETKELSLHVAQLHHIKQVADASSKDFEAIHQATGGSPLAIQLIIGQLSHLPFNVILHNLEKIPSLTHSSQENEYVSFYRYIFWHSWNNLTQQSKRLLVTLTPFSSTNGADFEALQNVSQIPYDHLLSSIQELWTASLIEIGPSTGMSEVRYLLHPLTKNFVLSDIVKVTHE